MDNEKIRSYLDLRVYQRSYNACLVVMKEIVPSLPDTEKYDLKDQLSRSSKAIPRLIAEGYAKKHQKAGFQKYLDDALGESNESQVSLCQSKDIYPHHVDVAKCVNLISEYDIIGRQLFCLRESWSKFSPLPPKQSKPKNKSENPQANDLVENIGINPTADNLNQNKNQTPNIQTGSTNPHLKPIQ